MLSQLIFVSAKSSLNFNLIQNKTLYPALCQVVMIKPMETTTCRQKKKQCVSSCILTRYTSYRCIEYTGNSALYMYMSLYTDCVFGWAWCQLHTYILVHLLMSRTVEVFMDIFIHCEYVHVRNYSHKSRTKTDQNGESLRFHNFKARFLSVDFYKYMCLLWSDVRVSFKRKKVHLPGNLSGDCLRETRPACKNIHE